MAELLLGTGAPASRRKGCELMIAAVTRARKADVVRVRAMMAGLSPSKFIPRADLTGTVEAWRRIQVRQAFRLSLEALLYWVMWQIEQGPLSTEALVGAFLDQVGRPRLSTAREWLNAAGRSGNSPTTLMDRLSQAMEDASQTELASAVADSLAFCIAEAPEHGQIFERVDRLPLFSAPRSRGLGQGSNEELRAACARDMGARTTCVLVSRPWTGRCTRAGEDHSPSESHSGGGGLDFGSRSVAGTTAAYARQVGDSAHPSGGIWLDPRRGLTAIPIQNVFVERSRSRARSRSHTPVAACRSYPFRSKPAPAETAAICRGWLKDVLVIYPGHL